MQSFPYGLDLILSRSEEWVLLWNVECGASSRLVSGFQIANSYIVACKSFIVIAKDLCTA